MIILSTSLIILSLIGYKFNLKILDIVLLILGFLLLTNFYYKNNEIDNIINKFTKLVNNNEINNSNQPLIKNNHNQEPEWTPDQIIPLNKYNPKDCTNDNTCIIPPDDINQYPTWKNAPKLETRQNLDLNTNDKVINLDKSQHCMICLKNIDPLKNPITEDFTNFNPYGHFEEINKKNNNINCIKKIYKNIKNNKSNNNISLTNIKQISNQICHHCKVGLCVNDGCISL